MTYWIALSGFTNFVATNFLWGQAKHFWLIIQVWLFFWLWISSISPTGIFLPKENSVVIFLLFFSSITFGGILFKAGIGSIGNPFSSHFFTGFINQRNFRVSQVLFFCVCVLILPITTFYFLRSLFQIISFESLEAYRNLTFGKGGQSVVFGNNSIMALYFVFIKPTIYFTTFTGLALFVKTQKKHLLYLGYALLIMDSIMMLGRFGFYSILILEILSFFCKLMQRQTSIAKVFKLSSFMFVVIIIVIILGVSIMRMDAKDAGSYLLESFVLYHTAGFVIFDDDLNNPNSMLNREITLGRAFLGDLERLPILLLLRPMGIDVDSVPAKISENVFLHRTIGFKKNGGRIVANAFTTIVYHFYIDGRFFMVIICGSLYGFFLAKYSNGFWKNPSVYCLTMLCLLFHSGIFFIFHGGVPWLIIIFTKLIHNVLNEPSGLNKARIIFVRTLKP